MKRVLILVGAWAGATLAAAVVAWAAVGIVDDQVSADVDLPLTAAEVEEISAARVTTTDVPAVTTTVPAVTTSTTFTSPASTTPPPAVTTVPTPTTTTTTTSPVTTTTAGELTEAIRVTGGSVVIRWSPEGGARLTSATPDSGWSVDVEHGGPPSVEVKFEGPDTETEVHVEVSNAELKIEVGED